MFLDDGYFDSVPSFLTFENILKENVVATISFLSSNISKVKASYTYLKIIKIVSVHFIQTLKRIKYTYDILKIHFKNQIDQLFCEK